MGWREVGKAGRQGHSKMQHVERENEGMAPERGTGLCWKKQTPEFPSRFAALLQCPWANLSRLDPEVSALLPEAPKAAEQLCCLSFPSSFLCVLKGRGLREKMRLQETAGQTAQRSVRTETSEAHHRPGHTGTPHQPHRGSTTLWQGNIPWEGRRSKRKASPHPHACSTYFGSSNVSRDFCAAFGA